jgi:hypothetical protein
MTDERDIKIAAQVIADAAEDAANRVAIAAKSAVDSAASAASSASSAAQILGAVAIARLDAVDRQFSAHEKQDSERFEAVVQGQREIKEELKGDIKEINADLKKQTRTITLITGGIIALSRIPDLISLIHH